MIRYFTPPMIREVQIDFYNGINTLYGILQVLYLTVRSCVREEAFGKIQVLTLLYFFRCHTKNKKEKTKARSSEFVFVAYIGTEMLGSHRTLVVRKKVQIIFT